MKVVCQNKKCKKEFEVRPDKVAKGNGKFCSKKCFYEVTNTPEHTKHMVEKRWVGHKYITKEEFLQKQRVRGLRWARKNKDYFKNNYLKNKEKIDKRNMVNFYKKQYGITPEQKIELLKEQNHQCKICSKQVNQKTGNIDHDHKNKIVRGILCNPCNQAIGLFHDDIQLLKRAIDYLEGGEIKKC